jgi:crossover junction endodeoxyribonuclease RuvC
VAVRIIGIDPGTRVVGYGVVDLKGGDLVHVAHGAFDVRKSDTYPQQLRRIYEGLAEAIKAYKPDVCVVEQIFHAKSAGSAIKTGEGRGVALLAAAVNDVPVVEYAATSIKKSVTGAGGAHKTQVQKMVRLQLGLREVPKPADASDALACAICHCHQLRFESRRMR